MNWKLVKLLVMDTDCSNTISSTQSTIVEIFRIVLRCVLVMGFRMKHHPVPSINFLFTTTTVRFTSTRLFAQDNTGSLQGWSDYEKPVLGARQFPQRKIDQEATPLLGRKTDRTRSTDMANRSYDWRKGVGMRNQPVENVARLHEDGLPCRPATVVVHQACRPQKLSESICAKK